MYPARARLKVSGQMSGCRRCCPSRVQARQASSATQEALQEQEDPLVEPVWVQAGPSRRGRYPRFSRSNNYSDDASNTRGQASSFAEYPTVRRPQLHSRGAISRARNRSLRDYLDRLAWEEMGRTKDFLKRHPTVAGPSFDSLSRLDTHTIVHHCIRTGRPWMAVELMIAAIDFGLAQEPKRKGRFSSRTLSLLFSECAARLQAGIPPVLPRPDDVPDSQADVDPTPVDFISHYSRIIGSIKRARSIQKLQNLLALLGRLQDLRHHRPIEVYEALISSCVELARPDLAAGVYVGMVEEWIMEGRIAIGAQIEHFYDGGGPPEQGRHELELASDLLKTWWQGIRSWSLPGEVLSPHGRIDLWHPRKLALSEKMRNFPLPNPTSPPTLVPAPAENLLEMIVSNLHLDPDIVSYEEFAISMRACATLANTIHSRTLPLLSKGTLMRALGRTPFMPKVYPEGIDPRSLSARDEWAYTAYTHIHLALQSLCWRPPISSVSLERTRQIQQAATQEGGVTPTKPSVIALYGMAPLSIPACRALLKYGFRRLKDLSAAKPLLRYVSSRFARPRLSGIITDLFYHAVGTSDEKLMHETKELVFSTPESHRLTGGQQPAQGTNPDSVTAKEDVFVDTIKRSTAADVAKIGSTMSLDEPQERFIILFVYYVRTHQPERIRQLVHELIPSLGKEEADIVRRRRERGQKDPYLRPRLYKKMLWALRMVRETRLAQQVFHEALQADRFWKQRHGLWGEDRDDHRILIHTYTAMLDVWRDVALFSKRERHVRRRPDISGLERFSGPYGYDYLPVPRQPTRMILHIYGLARSSWLEAAWDPETGVIHRDRARGIAPDALLLSTMVDACGARWGLDLRSNKFISPRGRQAFDVSPRVRQEIRNFIIDMEQFGLEIPRILRLRAMDPAEAARQRDMLNKIPGRRDFKNMKRRMKHRETQDVKGRIIQTTTREEKSLRDKDMAAELWSWQTRGGGRMSSQAAQRSQSKWEKDQSRRQSLEDSGPIELSQEDYSRWSLGSSD
ncbi:hypothetical protein BD324DRAFT_680827 [Kockovaella imperatae]|uniref:Mitochondrial ATPase expression-domain-containing protein n=1 Tax=Kockovaella imperatae TaxID=4999 RepID=A0A1Y1UK92_9TREE|nr:hypothetical protein BD324DRAFT_680827 [Kockovaella imperatae]ORX37957.1 hypothetical protein BD324DRAFT_680827 [Kockovaella imperatae]